MGGDSTPAFNNLYQDDTNSRDGNRFTTTTFGKLVFTADFLMIAKSYYDQKLLRHEMYQIFGDRDLVRFRTDIDFQKVMYGRPASFDIKHISDGNSDSVFSIQFEIPSGYKYSLTRSDQISSDDISFGMNFKLPERPTYTHSENKFRIYNPSDIAIDPYYQRHDLLLRINFEGDFYRIENKTNATAYQFNRALTMNENVMLNGLKTSLNGLPDSKDSDFGYLKLEKGWNDIVVTGATSHRTIFSFPFVYID
ncbi:hypothetical protein LKI_01740 [Leuconostoc kimchii IMSNU 11154]|uniref:Siphovirus-type tail component RIFT-related domain-containing protein n=1 Tax=Leuconostoc kimchii (strain IMSNU 11154 / KCTC 2386 / IH25) TaxID=762051 RepID=D5T0U2_LEUKI|nr:phage tail domain-containing protein [Leuconostoc kimchii]ADG39891.1 hypothetical protein LKI_01740 [Leuconostoc kimchii IMSNU 11154]